MAGIDKIYCESYKQYIEFYDWCKMFQKECFKDTQYDILEGFYYTPEEFADYFSKDGYHILGVPMTNFCESINMWLIKHCPIDWIRDRVLNEQYRSLNIKNKDIELYLNKG